MAKNISQLIQEKVEDGTLAAALNNKRVQFGTKTSRRIGAELLPERTVKTNQYSEVGVRFRSLVANDGSRYSPAQKKGDAIVASFDVKLLESDIAIELTAEEYDSMNSFLAVGNDVEASAVLVKAFDRVARGLADKDEVRRWEALVDAKITRKGDNGFSEEIDLSSPDLAAHRVEAALAWEDAAADPFEDIAERVQLLTDKGFSVGRIITSKRLVSRMARNAKVKERAGGVRVTLAVINEMLSEDSLPAIETYDEVYHDFTGTHRFLVDNAMVFVALTGRDESVFIAEDEVEMIENTLGYTGVGQPAGQSASGRAYSVEAFTNKPPRVEIEGWQTSGPVFLEPEAVSVLKVPAQA